MKREKLIGVVAQCRMNWNRDSYEVEEDGDQNDVEHDGSGHNYRQNDDNEKLVDRESTGRKFAGKVALRAKPASNIELRAIVTDVEEIQRRSRVSEKV